MLTGASIALSIFSMPAPCRCDLWVEQTQTRITLPRCRDRGVLEQATNGRRLCGRRRRPAFRLKQ